MHKMAFPQSLPTTTQNAIPKILGLRKSIGWVGEVIWAVVSKVRKLPAAGRNFPHGNAAVDPSYYA